MHVEIPTASRRDRFLILRTLPAFEALSDDDLRSMSDYLKPRRFDAGTLITDDGEPHRFVYLVHEGRVRVTSEGRPVMIVEAPGGFGYLATLSGQKTTLRAVAETATATFELPVEQLWETMYSNFNFVRNGLRLNAQALLELRRGLPVNPNSDYVAQIGERPERETTLVERMLVLLQAQLFAGLNIDAIIDVARRSRTARYPPGTTLWEIGDASTFSVRIDYGVVTCTSADGQSVDVGWDFALGNMDGLADLPRAYRAVTKTEVVANVIRLDDILATMEAHPEFGIKLLEIFTKRRFEERLQAASKA